ncbi:LppU/SCO3897 family protein [Mycobacteroides abscessus]|uniref:LppU/SCO3897 family protein n=1 Tax=Mycobacteroides abscessus TaxID=36809 RepID=UPI004024F2DE
MTIKVLSRGSALVAILVLATCCSNHEVEDATRPQSTSPSQVNFDQIPGQFPPQEPGIPGASIAPVGACVSFEGPSNNATLKVVDCGSPSNGHKVIQRVITPDQCPADVAQKFYMNPDEGQFTACLDYAWNANDCLSIGKVTAVRAACDDTSKPNREKPLKVILNTTTNAGCGPTGGFPHAVRKFTVCTETQK